MSARIELNLFRSEGATIDVYKRQELLRVTVATVLTGFLHYVGITLFFEAMPISYIQMCIRDRLEQVKSVQ